MVDEIVKETVLAVFILDVDVHKLQIEANDAACQPQQDESDHPCDLVRVGHFLHGGHVEVTADIDDAEADEQADEERHVPVAEGLVDDRDADDDDQMRECECQHRF